MKSDRVKSIVKKRIHGRLKLFIYPSIYFAVVGLACLYAWFGSYPKGAVKIVFVTIALFPSLFWVMLIVTWLMLSVLLVILEQLFARRFPDAYLTKVLKKLSGAGDAEGKGVTTVAMQGIAGRRRILNILTGFAGALLISAGIFLFVWIARPYINLLISSDKIHELERKSASGQVQGNRIVIPSLLVDSPIIEGVDAQKLSRGVCHVSMSALPGEGGNVIIEGHNLAEFGLWKPMSFFSLLELADKGTAVYVFYNGKKYVYTVKDKSYKDVGDATLYDADPGERLTLLTCVSTWSPTIYTNRRTVIVAYPE